MRGGTCNAAAAIRSSSGGFWAKKLFSPSFRSSAGESRRFSSAHPPPPPAAPKPSASRAHRRRNGGVRRKSAPPQSKASSPEALLQNISAIIAPEGEKPPHPAACAEKVGEEEGGFAGDGVKICRRDARRNAPAGLFPVRWSEEGDDEEEEDVSPTVQRITAIVRSGGGAAAMEERLGSAPVELTAEVAEMVVKRCFKAGDAALRFFSWARRRPGFRHTTATYNAMLYMAGEAREFGLVDELLRWMEEDSCPADVKTWTILVRHFGRGKKIGRALWAFEQTKKCRSGPDKMAYASIIHALCQAGKAEMAVEFYREMAAGGMVADGDLYQALMTALAASGDVATARLIGEDMARASSSDAASSSSSSLMLKSFCISGNLEAAMALAGEMRKKTQRLDSEKVEILVAALCKAGRVSEALELVTGAEKDGVLDRKLYGHIVSGYLRLGDVQSALKFLRRCSPAVRTYTELIQHLSRAGEHGMACELYDEMVANGAEPDMVAVVAMLAGHVQNGRVAEAWSLFEGMKKKETGMKPTRKAYSVFIRELCKSGEPEEALRALAEMLRSDLAPPGEDIFRLVCNSLREKGLPEKASMVEQMRLGLSSANEDAAEVSNQSQGGRRWSDDELKEVERILASPSDDWASMAGQFRKSGILLSPELAEEVLRRRLAPGGAALRFFSWAGKSAGFTHTAGAYNLAIKIAGVGKDFAFMRHLHEEMKRKGCPRTVDTWTTMIAQYGRAGLTEMALRKFAEMKSEGFRPDASTFKFLIIFLCGKKGRKVAEAEKAFHEMLSAGISPDRELADSFLSCLCESGKTSEARSCVEALIARGFAAQVGFSLLVKSLCRAGRLEEALELVDEAGAGAGAHWGCRADQFVYGSLIHGLLRGGREAAALEKMEEMKRAGLPATAQVYTSLMVHFFREKRPEKATAVLEKMEEEGCEPTVVTFSALIRGYVGAGKVAAAWAVFRRMAAAGAPPDFQTYSTFMACLCWAGRSEEAMELIQEMAARGISPSAVNFRTVLYGLNREGKRDLARALLEKKWAFSRKRRFLA